MINELEKRREEANLEQSIPVRLSDGQDWFIPRPFRALMPHFKDGQVTDHHWEWRYSPELDSILTRIAAATNDVELIGYSMALAGKLVLQNYELEPEELATILFFRVDDPRDSAMLTEIVDVATARKRA